MLWLKAFHIVFVVAWFAGLFYLPRLFVYHADATDAAGIARFKIMERRLYNGIMTPAAVLSVALGLAMLWLGWSGYAGAGWMRAKLALVIALVVYHVYLGRLVQVFRDDRNTHGSRYYRWLNELPTVLLVAVVVLVVVQPI